jgi:tripartite-type tricarboxylate transporter receptor subunit TctC
MLKSAILGCAALCAALFMPGEASAQQPWPTRPVTFMVPFAAGGGTDAFARPLAAQLEKQLGQGVVIENRAGAGGTAGANVASRAAPDGYYFLVGAAHHTIAPSLYPRLDYDIEKDFIPIAIIAQPPQIIVVNPRRIAATSLAELIALAKSKPDGLVYGSAGIGTTHHLSAELFKLLTQTQIRHVPYRGAGPAMADLVSGQIDMVFDGLGTSAPQIQGGQIRGIALAAAARNAAIPNVPTAAEAGLQNFDVSTWYALFAPKNTPAPIIERMRREVRTALATPLIRDAWERNGSSIPTLEGEEFGRFVSAEVARWRKVVTEAGIKLE